MGTEYEKRYLVFTRPSLEGIAPILIKQGYLSTTPEKTIRVRLTPEKSELTIKGLRVEGEAPEFNFPVPRDEAEQLMDLCGDTALTKDRYPVSGHDGKIWELDVFTGRHAGLIIAELEMNRGDAYLKPVWLNDAVDITSDNRFSNAVLATTHMDQISAWIAEYRIKAAKPGMAPS